MAVQFDAESESHTGTTGSASQASFTWNHIPVGIPRGIVVFTFVNANANDATSVTYGGVSMTAVGSGRAVDTAGEPGDCKAWFLGASIPTGTQAVVVNRTNNANVMYAVAFSVTGDADMEVKGTPVLLQEDGTITVQAVDAGTGVNALRFAGTQAGGNGVPPTGTGSTAGPSIDFGLRTCATVRESSPGPGSRNVGFNETVSDDRAAVHLAVGEVVVAFPFHAVRPYHPWVKVPEFGPQRVPRYEGEVFWTAPEPDQTPVVVEITTRTTKPEDRPRWRPRFEPALFEAVVAAADAPPLPVGRRAVTVALEQGRTVRRVDLTPFTVVAGPDPFPPELFKQRVLGWRSDPPPRQWSTWQTIVMEGTAPEAFDAPPLPRGRRAVAVAQEQPRTVRRIDLTPFAVVVAADPFPPELQVKRRTTRAIETPPPFPPVRTILLPMESAGPEVHEALLRRVWRAVTVAPVQGRTVRRVDLTPFAVPPIVDPPPLRLGIRARVVEPGQGPRFVNRWASIFAGVPLVTDPPPLPVGIRARVLEPGQGPRFVNRWASIFAAGGVVVLDAPPLPWQRRAITLAPDQGPRTVNRWASIFAHLPVDPPPLRWHRRAVTVKPELGPRSVNTWANLFASTPPTTMIISLGLLIDVRSGPRYALFEESAPRYELTDRSRHSDGLAPYVPPVLPVFDAPPLRLAIRAQVLEPVQGPRYRWAPMVPADLHGEMPPPQAARRAVVVEPEQPARNVNRLARERLSAIFMEDFLLDGRYFLDGVHLLNGVY